jgi:hypothetical protein
MVTEICPTHHTYDYAIIFGALIHTVRKRIAYLVKLWHEGIRWNSLVILSGQRNLDPILESDTTWNDASLLPIKTSWKLSQVPKTEIDMIQMVLEQSVLPADWTTIPTTLINTPMQLKEFGLLRPNTADTILCWLTTHPTPGSIVAISTQPYICYQDAILKRILPSSFSIETVGPEIDPCEVQPEILIGTIGWWLYHAFKYT